MQPQISVGIVRGQELKVVFDSPYTTSDITVVGPETFTISNSGTIIWQGIEYEELDFIPNGNDGSFDVVDVTIGVDFHWERQETQKFTGCMRIIVEGDKLTLINRLPVEDYLKSVISSEMSASANIEFLKAHAVISRSWILAQIHNRGHKTTMPSSTLTDTEIVRWYDREDHINFDVCADDHCQRYQGITRCTTETVDEAVEQTKGIVLLDDNGDICDARFSKCCGGVFEQFENCWEPVFHNYLVARSDSENPLDFPDLRKEDEARRWILEAPKAYCNTRDGRVLAQVLNNYDQETSDFYRWSISYNRRQLADLIRTRSGIDFGDILSLEPLERGTSGRIIRLRIRGTKQTMVIGKELMIRRTLSTSHLYSSAFVVETGNIDANGVPGLFTLHGAGWGHGVGLCQIGAAVMSDKGYTYESILNHYFPGSVLHKSY